MDGSIQYSLLLASILRDGIDSSDRSAIARVFPRHSSSRCVPDASFVQALQSVVDSEKASIARRIRAAATTVVDDLSPLLAAEPTIMKSVQADASRLHSLIASSSTSLRNTVAHRDVLATRSRNLRSALDLVSSLGRALLGCDLAVGMPGVPSILVANAACDSFNAVYAAALKERVDAPNAAGGTRMRPPKPQPAGDAGAATGAPTRVVAVSAVVDAALSAARAAAAAAARARIVRASGVVDAAATEVGDTVLSTAVEDVRAVTATRLLTAAARVGAAALTGGGCAADCAASAAGGGLDVGCAAPADEDADADGSGGEDAAAPRQVEGTVARECSAVGMGGVCRVAVVSLETRRPAPPALPDDPLPPGVPTAPLTPPPSTPRGSDGVDGDGDADSAAARGDGAASVASAVTPRDALVPPSVADRRGSVVSRGARSRLSRRGARAYDAHDAAPPTVPVVVVGPPAATACLFGGAALRRAGRPAVPAGTGGGGYSGAVGDLAERYGGWGAPYGASAGAAAVPHDVLATYTLPAFATVAAAVDGSRDGACSAASLLDGAMGTSIHAAVGGGAGVASAPAALALAAAFSGRSGHATAAPASPVGGSPPRVGGGARAVTSPPPAPASAATAAESGALLGAVSGRAGSGWWPGGGGTTVAAIIAAAASGSPASGTDALRDAECGGWANAPYVSVTGSGVPADAVSAAVATPAGSDAVVRAAAAVAETAVMLRAAVGRALAAPTVVSAAAAVLAGVAHRVPAGPRSGASGAADDAGSSVCADALGRLALRRILAVHAAAAGGAVAAGRGPTAASGAQWLDPWGIRAATAAAAAAAAARAAPPTVTVLAPPTDAAIDVVVAARAAQHVGAHLPPLFVAPLADGALHALTNDAQHVLAAALRGAAVGDVHSALLDGVRVVGGLIRIVGAPSAMARAAQWGSTSDVIAPAAAARGPQPLLVDVSSERAATVLAAAVGRVVTSSISAGAIRLLPTPSPADDAARAAQRKLPARVWAVTPAAAADRATACACLLLALCDDLAVAATVGTAALPRCGTYACAAVLTTFRRAIAMALRAAYRAVSPAAAFFYSVTLRKFRRMGGTVVVERLCGALAGCDAVVISGVVDGFVAAAAEQCHAAALACMSRNITALLKALGDVVYTQGEITAAQQLGESVAALVDITVASCRDVLEEPEVRRVLRVAAVAVESAVTDAANHIIRTVEVAIAAAALTASSSGAAAGSTSMTISSSSTAMAQATGGAKAAAQTQTPAAAAAAAAAARAVGGQAASALQSFWVAVRGDTQASRGPGDASTSLSLVSCLPKTMPFAAELAVAAAPPAPVMGMKKEAKRKWW